MGALTAPASAWLRNSVRSLPTATIERLVRALTGPEAAALTYDWYLWARSEQLVPGDDTTAEPWLVWLVLAGRGWGKTRTGAEAVRQMALRGGCRRLALIAPTAADARDVVVEGESGLLAVHPPHERPRFEPSKRRVTWPNGAVGFLYSAEEPERLRGPQHDFFWGDEVRAWPYPDAAWDNLQFGLRLGARPRGVVTTTARPMALLRRLVARAGADVVVTRGHTLDNAAHLPPSQVRYLLDKYAGTTVGRQELAAELLGEMPGALWTLALLDGCRRAVPSALTRIVIGVDPTVSAEGTGAECGIVAAGRDAEGRGYVLRDWSVRGSPKVWATAAVEAYTRHGANVIVAEGNQGGALVKAVLHALDPRLPVRVVYASQGKAARAEPIVMRYENGTVHHARGAPLSVLEDQLVTWVPGEPSPDRLDALVWALTALLVQGRGPTQAAVY